jgi:type II secretory pathway component PulL
MTAKHWVLFQERSRWRIAALPGETATLAETEPARDDSPDAAVEALRSQGYRGEPVLLALDSSLCLAASVEMDDPAAARHRQSLLYQLEEHLPLAAEEIAADFVIGDGRFLGVAIPSAPQKILVDALETRGVQVQSISPTAMLAAQHHVRTGDRRHPHLLIWGNAAQVELIRLADGKPTAWSVLPAEPAAAAKWLKVEAIAHEGPTPVIAHAPSELSELLASAPEIKLETSDDETLLDAAAQTAMQILSGHESPWIELRRDALAPSDSLRAVRGPLRLAAVALAVLLLAVSISALVRANRYDQLAARDQERLAAVFSEAMPGQSVPASVRARLESELQKLSGAKGTSADPLSQRPSLAVLYDFLASIPQGLRMRLLEIRIARGRIQLDGELRSHGDADALSVALRGRGFQVQPPHTQQLSGQGVAVRMAADAGQPKPSPQGDHG